ncbi:CCR4-NOT transcription complex subunit 10-like [Populus alba x Populus x berolinensis]|nr:CCR4-NOT transcription complex subunit 10-like [Populus alba x Populus x berolinensis]
MDARDSTSNRDVSSSGGSGTTTGGVGGEEDPILSVTAALAKDAWLHFNSRRFNECLEVLYQLKQKKEDDPKVLHNIAIAEYCRDGYPDPKKLLGVLNNVERKSKELAHTSGEQVETVSNLGNKVISGSKGSGAMTLQASATNSTSVVHMDDFDPTVARLNIAIIWYHLHEYSKALSVLEPLYHNIEPIEERTALHVCLLLLDVALACQDASKSADVLLYLEKAFGFGCVGQSENGNTAQQQSASLVAKSLSVPSSSSGMDANSDLASSENALEKSLSRTLSLSDETLEYESMFSLDISGQDLARPAGLSFATDLSRTPIDRSFSPSEMKLKLHLYKVQFLLLTRNLKQAKREVKLAINIARVRDSPMALLLKSQLEYARSNHRKAIKLLMAASNRTEMGISSMFNNLGCIYYQLGKYHTASVLFSKALSSSSSLQKDKPWKLLTFLQDKSLLIVYNCGVQHLACGKPLLAARCFEKASLVFYNRPLLWLRLAECCLVALERGLLKATRVLSDRSDVTVHVFGKGKWRHLAIENGISRNGYVDSVEKEDMFLGSDGQLKLSVPLARQCLLNALHLLDYSGLNHLKPGLPSNLSLDENEMSEAGSMKSSNHKNLTGFDSKTSTGGVGQVNANGDAKEQKGGTSQEIMQNSISFHEDIRRRENQLLKQALLANLAYVELELENPEKALSTARSLLELPVCSRIYIFLGHLYAAEALCMLNKPKEAAEHLSIYLSGGNNVELPFSQEDFEQWRVEKAFDYEEMNGGSVATKNSSPEESQGIVFLNPEEARGTLYTNFAVLCAAQGDLERAHHFVTQALSLVPNHPQATLTAVYVDLMLCNSQAAIGKLKQCSRVRFLPSGVQSSKC